jgi:hypothetical protein
MEDNCSVSGANPREVTVAAGGSAQTTFNIACSSLLGSLRVLTTTTGADVDPDGYTAVVDGTTSQSIAVNGSVTFSGLTAGTHSVELADVASNCSIAGDNPSTATVPVGASTDVAFQVTCGAVTGAIEVIVETSGTDLDPDGYLVLLDGGSSKTATVNDTLTFTNVVPGDHSVQLSGIASNCGVSGPNPLTTTVVAGNTTHEAFVVACTSPLGELRVGASTSGSSSDPDGYVASVDGGARTTRIGVNGETGFGGLTAGDHEVALLDVADNCQVFGDNPRTVAVIGAQTVTITFLVECSSTVGEIRVRSNTSGVDLDPNGYVAEIDEGFRTTRIGVNDETGFGNLIPGEHQVGLTDVATNCTVLGQNPRTVTLAAGQTLFVSFGVECTALGACVTPPPGIVAWWTGDGTPADLLGVHNGSEEGTVSYDNGYVTSGTGEAFFFNGAGEVRVPDHTDLNPTTEFSIETWVKFDPPSGSSSSFGLAFADTAMVDEGFALFSDDYWRGEAAIIGKGESEQYVIDYYHNTWRGFIRPLVWLESKPYTTGWTHLALTGNGSVLTLYVNGNIADTGTTSGINTSDTYLGIGGRPNGRSHFYGWIDEVTFYNRSLTTSEVFSIYDAHESGKCK